MKKNICFILTEMMIVMMLACACSDGQTAEEILESRDDVLIEAVTPEDVTSTSETVTTEQSDSGTDDAADAIIAPDLNHNGVAEEVRMTDTDDGQGQRLEIWENNELIYSQEGYFDFEASYFEYPGRTSIFLCTLDGDDYLLRYQPSMYQGVCTYSYELSTLTDNRKNVVQWNSVNFDINFGYPVHNSFDPGAIAVFMDEINELLSHSVQLLNTDSDLLDTFEKEGRLYDSLWWMDDRGPEFIRDGSKSLLENLKDFQTTMTVGRELVIAEEVDGLPITESLEMAFYSGAGAWGTYLTLNPDGSFAGDYHDADMYTIYVCQFHGQFGKVEKLTDASWLLTLTELKLDTGCSVGEGWDETDGDYTVHYISSDPYGFNDADGTALRPGAQFILYSPDATGHEPGTELYGAMEFQSWMHKHKEFNGDGDILDCWGLQNMETGQGFFGD